MTGSGSGSDPRLKVIRIHGTEHSGSTLMDLMLGNTGSGLSVGEIHSWFRPQTAHHRALGCLCGEEDCPVLGRIAAMSEKNLYLRIGEEFGVEYLVDSSKNLVWFHDMQERGGEGVAYYDVVIYKRPQEYAFSMYKREKHTNWKKRYCSHYRRCARALTEFVAVSYSDLAQRPDWVMQRLCSVTDVPYDQRMNEYATHEFHLFGGSALLRKSLQRGTKIVTPEQGEPAPGEFLAAYARQRCNRSKMVELLDLLAKNDLGGRAPMGGRGEVRRDAMLSVDRAKYRLYRLLSDLRVFSPLFRLRYRQLIA